MSSFEYNYIALFADDDPANLAERDKYPHICCIPVSDTPIVVDLESGLYIRSKANTNDMQQMIDDRFVEDFGNERLYHARSGLSIRQIDGIYDQTTQHPSIRHVFFDHDLTLTCHQGLISIDQMNRVCDSFPLTVSKYFDQWVSYFFGSSRRYQALYNLLDNLKAGKIKTYILTKQPDTLTIEHFLRLCKLHVFFPHSRCISSAQLGKEKLTIINDVLGIARPPTASRSPRGQAKTSAAHVTQSPPKAGQLIEPLPIGATTAIPTTSRPPEKPAHPGASSAKRGGAHRNSPTRRKKPA